MNHLSDHNKEVLLMRRATEVELVYETETASGTSNVAGTKQQRASAKGNFTENYSADERRDDQALIG